MGEFIPQDPKIAVIGLGYVGLPLALALARHNRVIGFDTAADRVAQLRQGIDHTGEVAAADLAVAAAIASSAFDVALPSDMVVFGEVSLSGDVRTVSRADARLKEAHKLGFERAIAAPLAKRNGRNDNTALPIIPIRSLRDLVRRVEAAAERGPDVPESWAA